MMAKYTFPLLGIVLLLVAGTGCKPPASAEKDNTSETAAAPVTALTVTPRLLDERVDVTGTLQPHDEVEVGTRYAGRMAWIIGKAGTRVEKGQLVARLEEHDAQTQVRAATAALQAAKARLEQAKAAALQQATATDTGIATAQAGVEAAQARLEQAKTAAEAQDATAKAQVKAADAAVDAAKSRLTLLKNGSRTQERKIAEQNVTLAQATYNLDKANFDRYRQLYDKGAVSKAILDGAETKMKVSEAQLQSAKQQLSLVQEGPRQEDIQTAEAAVRQAQEGLDTAKANLKQTDVAFANVEIAKTGVSQAKAALEAAKSARQVNVMRDKDVLAAQAVVQQAREALTSATQLLDYMYIYSPVSGVVAARMAEVGQSMGSGESVLKISTNNMLYFEAQVSELEAPRLRAGQQVTLTVDALQGDRGNLYAGKTAHIFAGAVEKVVPVVDARTRNFTVRVMVPASPALFPGMFTRGAIVVARHPNAVTVPKDALVKRDGRTLVFVAEDDVARERAVTLGASDAAAVQVLSGVNPGDRLIVTGQQTLKDGDKISVAEAKTN
ncbi:MAG: Multidrug resistance protein MdtA precursor [bacterium ADurb.Bin429]|nr:MAG: Multidrug resistance protein MdtA precursor [bacterium ADurb.Bin429]